MKRIFWYIGKSLINAQGKVSSSRLSSYFILFSILGLGTVFMGIEIGNACLSWYQGNSYIVPFEHITIFAMILAHHLVLLGLKNANDKSTNTLSNLNLEKPENSKKGKVIDNSIPDNPDVDHESED